MLELISEESKQLERWAVRRTSAQGLALRSRIVLACTTGLTNKKVATQLGISMPTVGKWYSRLAPYLLPTGRTLHSGAPNVGDIMTT